MYQHKLWKILTSLSFKKCCSKNVQMWRSMTQNETNLLKNQDQLTSAERAMSKGVRPLEDSTFLSTPYFKSNATTSKLPSLASNLKLDIFHGKRSAGFMLIPCDQVAARCTGYTTCDVENKRKQPVQHNRKGVRTHRKLCLRFVPKVSQLRPFVSLGRKSLIRNVQSKKIEARNIWADGLKMIKMIQRESGSSCLSRSCFLMKRIRKIPLKIFKTCNTHPTTISSQLPPMSPNLWEFECAVIDQFLQSHTVPGSRSSAIQ